MMTSTTEPDASAPVTPQERASARAWYALAVLIVAMLFGFINRQILTLLVGPIKHDLSLSDLQIGETHGLGPAIFSAVAIYPLAWLADRTERRTVMAGCVIFWSLATAASGLAVDFPTLLAATIAIVIGEACLSPFVYSLIADLFPERTRPRANIIAYAATVLGSGLGLTLGGALIGVIDDLRPMLPVALRTVEAWRLAFFLVAVPGPIVAVGVFMIGRTRRQVATAQGAVREPSAPIVPYLKKHGLVALGVFGVMGLFNFALQAMGTWLPVAVIRTFKADAGTVGVNFGLSFMAGAAVGLVVTTLLTPFWKRVAGTAFVLRAISVAAVGVAVPTVLFAFATELWQAYALTACWSAIFVTGVALMPGMMQDVAPAALRTRVIAIGTVVFMVMGAIGSPIVGFLSDKVAGHPKGLMLALVTLAVAGYAACAVVARLVEGPYRRTVAEVAGK
jgi:MFS family permease